MARPPKFSPEKAEAIAKLVTFGVPIGDAAQAEGISRATLYNWRARSLEGKQPYKGFVEQLDGALARAKTNIMLNVIRLSRKDWRAGAWWIERHDPTPDQKLQAALQSLIEEVRPHMSADAYGQLIEAIAIVMGLTELDPQSAQPPRSLAADVEVH